MGRTVSFEPRWKFFVEVLYCHYSVRACVIAGPSREAIEIICRTVEVRKECEA